MTLMGTQRESRDSALVGSFGNRLDAELAKIRLEDAGLQSTVVEPTGFNPLLNDSAGGIQLRVDGLHEHRARQILDTPLLDTEDDDGDTEVVRCPRCELEYCSFESPRIVADTAPGIALLAQALLRLGPKRWRCHKCAHVWDDPNEGPKRRTPALPDDPRPIFRLLRTRGGTGMFLGLIGSFFVGLVMSGARGPWLVAIAALGIAIGWFVGSQIGSDVCSEPTCRAPLPPNAERCEKCKGHIAGTIHTAPEHFARVAEFRRELEGGRAKKKPLKSKPKKKGRVVASARDA